MFLHGVGALAGVHATRGFGQKVLPESAGRTEVLAASLTPEDQKEVIESPSTCQDVSL